MIQRIVSATETTVPGRLYQVATVQKVQRLILGSQLCLLDTSSPSSYVPRQALTTCLPPLGQTTSLKP